jgi:hypothetical protein
MGRLKSEQGQLFYEFRLGSLPLGLHHGQGASRPRHKGDDASGYRRPKSVGAITRLNIPITFCRRRKRASAASYFSVSGYQATYWGF